MLVRSARDDRVCGTGNDAEVTRCVESGGNMGAVGGKSNAICMVICDLDCSVVALSQAFGRVVDQLPQVDGAVLWNNGGQQLERGRCVWLTSLAVARV